MLYRLEDTKPRFQVEFVLQDACHDMSEISAFRVRFSQESLYGQAPDISPEVLAER